MIIDLILDRKDGVLYDARDAYNYITQQESMFNTDYPISRAFDAGTNEDVQEALSWYVIDFGYNEEIVDYVKSVDWV